MHKPLVRYLIRRFLVLCATFCTSLVAIFILLRIVPGDPSDSLIPIGATPDQIRAAKHLVGTDKPLFFQFTHWVTQTASLHFGNSLTSGSPIAPEIFARLQITIPLTVSAFLIALTLSIPTGIIAARKGSTWYGKFLNYFSQLGIAIPVFWVGLISVYLFALRLNLLPAGGFPSTSWHDPAGAIKSLILPVLTVSFVMGASLTRYIKSATLDVLNSDFLRTSRSLGYSFGKSMWSHGIRNGAAPVISVLGIEFATTFVGAVVVETVFALPGLGSMLVKGIQEHDYSTVQGVLFVSTLIVMISGFIADILQKWLDPRLNKYSQGSLV